LREPNLWAIPLAITLAVLVLFLATMTWDVRQVRGVAWVPRPGWFSVGGPEDARAILGAILGTVSTVLALIFSLTLLVFSMAASQFGPRLIYRFIRDGATQVTIGLFLATFLHSLLAFVVERQEGGYVFVPEATILTSILLVVISFASLLVYGHRISMAIQASTVVSSIVDDVRGALAEAAANRAAAGGTGAAAQGDGPAPEVDALAARTAAEGAPVYAALTGYVQAIQHDELLAAADRAGAVVCLGYRPGQFVMRGAALAHVLPADRQAILAPAIQDHVVIGRHRTLRQDLEFGISQLVEIALRALSPAVNDTFTGLTCIDWLGYVLRQFAELPPWDGGWRAPSGTVRLLEPRLRFPRLVKAAFDQIREAAPGNPAVRIHLLQACARLAPHVQDHEHRRALRAQVKAAWEGASTEAITQVDRDDIEAAYRRAREALAGP
jgi:uncharacterized membrane protein